MTLNVARLKEYHICVALHLVTLEKPAWKIPLRWILKSFDFESSDTCNFPPKSEVTEIPFLGHKERAKNVLVIIHHDVCSPIYVVAGSGFIYLQKLTQVDMWIFT